MLFRWVSLRFDPPYTTLSALFAIPPSALDRHRKIKGSGGRFPFAEPTTKNRENFSGI